MTNQKLKSSLRDLPPKLRIYVQCRMEGMTQIASATAAGSQSPRHDAHRWEHDERVQAAIVEASDAIAEEVGFTRKEAHEMLMQAYANAETATEQIAAVRELINLHAIAKPKVIEHKHDHEHRGAIEHMPTDKLLELAGMDRLTIEGEFEVVEPEQLEGPGADEDEKILPDM